MLCQTFEPKKKIELNCGWTRFCLDNFRKKMRSAKSPGLWNVPPRQEPCILKRTTRWKIPNFETHNPLKNPGFWNAQGYPLRSPGFWNVPPPQKPWIRSRTLDYKDTIGQSLRTMRFEPCTAQSAPNVQLQAAQKPWSLNRTTTPKPLGFEVCTPPENPGFWSGQSDQEPWTLSNPIDNRSDWLKSPGERHHQARLQTKDPTQPDHRTLAPRKNSLHSNYLIFPGTLSSSALFLSCPLPLPLRLFDKRIRFRTLLPGATRPDNPLFEWTETRANLKNLTQKQRQIY